MFTWAIIKTAVSSHSFTSFRNLFLIKGNPLSKTYFLQKLPKKKFIETSFGLFGIRIIQEANITITTREVTKEIQRSLPRMFPFSHVLFFNQMSPSFAIA